jgi:hypothetical protein
MHWLMLVIEVWLLFGILTVVGGLMWTSKAAREALQKAPEHAARSHQSADFATTGLSEVRSA